MVQAFELDNDSDIDLQQAEAFLNAEEQARAARFKFQRDQDRFTRARALLRRTLADHLGKSPQTIEFSQVGNGKPVLAKGSLHFNLSHSAHIAVIALSTDHSIGIDLEHSSRSFCPYDLAEICFTAQEKAALRQHDQPEARFMAFWTAKEALMKLTGQGMSLEPRRISLRLDANGWPIGYHSVDGATANLRFIDLKISRTTCCLAYPLPAGGGEWNNIQTVSYGQ